MIANFMLIIIFINISIIMISSGKIFISMETWGVIDGKEVKKFILKNGKNQEVDVISYGATITAIRIPDKMGNVEDIVCGYDNIEGYLSKTNPYFGATIGRVANRIRNGRFVIDGTEYQVSRNIDNDTLHGGFSGWNSKIWSSKIENDTVVMTLLSKDKDEGFPGDVLVSVVFKLTTDGRLIVDMKSTTTKATPINLTNHSYFNLAGHGTHAQEIYKHKITINADRWTVTDTYNIPTGEIRPVNNSIMNLTKLTVLGDVINEVTGGGYDYNFCVSEYSDDIIEKFVAKVIHPNTGRELEIFSNQPGVQFYTANNLPDTNSSGILGKKGAMYFKHGAFCLETQSYPDAVNHKNFPDSILRPEHLYYHIVTYKFGVQI